jgi:hypothetical protein
MGKLRKYHTIIHNAILKGFLKNPNLLYWLLTFFDEMILDNVAYITGKFWNQEQMISKHTDEGNRTVSSGILTEWLTD